ncbi:DNA-directed RNA polymerase III subunit RPC7-like [Saccoglossus kowalevskii]|uniref:DNA-directed RNA polymerase III subunit n=1 Tax=Saccoglossus kowalevskii TaxID=10224 RepID=A0ABM0GIY2_SACKO|nr:PREDICTED: DNA-directed RNA polymerase III subunit RPC7-like [Saccoglossus kowalevskii]
MAGRGRGRGRGALAVAAEALGIGRGDLPPPTLQPPPLFPPLQFKPVPLLSGEDHDYMLALKQEYRGTMKDSPHYIKADSKKKDIERYSDKYQMNRNSDSIIGFQPDWERLPQELKIRVRRLHKSRAAVNPTLPISRKTKALSHEEIEKKLQNLEHKEESQTVEENEEEKEGEEEEEEYYDEIDEEEGTDYNATYFDNGEDFGLDEDDALDDGPVY